MTIQEMRDKKKEKGYTYAQMAELSGVPLGTIQKIFSGETESPRYDTLLALEQIFTEQSAVCEAAASYKTDRKQAEIPLSGKKTDFHTSFVHSNACAMIYSY